MNLKNNKTPFDTKISSRKLNNSLPFQFERGWTPVIKPYSTGGITVMKLIDFIGGEGDKPFDATLADWFLGANGYTMNINDAVEIGVNTGSPIEPTEFIELVDTPAGYNNSAGKYVRVNNSADGLEFEVIADTTSPVQSNWTEFDPNDLAFIKNKPTSLSQFTNDEYFITSNDLKQSDWNVTDTDDIAFIKNKPTTPTGVNTFIELEDTFNQYDQRSGHFLKVNSGGTSIISSAERMILYDYSITIPSNDMGTYSYTRFIPANYELVGIRAVAIDNHSSDITISRSLGEPIATQQPLPKTSDDSISKSLALSAGYIGAWLNPSETGQTGIIIGMENDVKGITLNFTLRYVLPFSGISL